MYLHFHIAQGHVLSCLVHLDHCVGGVDQQHTLWRRPNQGHWLGETDDLVVHTRVHHDALPSLRVC